LTVLPTIGDLSKVIVEGNWGLGESVVSGEINPDQFIVDKSDGTVERTVNRKTKMVVYHDGGTITAPVPDAIQEKPCVDPEELN
jgi:pyruvate,water dikinase